MSRFAASLFNEPFMKLTSLFVCGSVRSTATKITFVMKLFVFSLLSFFF